MAKKIVKKKKIKIVPLLIFLVVLGGLFFSCYYIFTMPLKNIVILNTSYLNDDYIINEAKIKNYPAFYQINTRKIKKTLLKSPYISDVNIKRKFFCVLEINITENRPLYIYEADETIVFSDKRSIAENEQIDIFRIPRVINEIPEEKRESFIKGMSKIEEGILGKISDIEYVPNEYDKDRFLLYMDDGNMVYLTLTKFRMIKYYNEVLGQLEGRKGILYLDSGNHFQIKE